MDESSEEQDTGLFLVLRFLLTFLSHLILSIISSLLQFKSSVN